MTTEYHAKIYAHELTKRYSSDSVEKFTATLMDSQVDLNPHQVDAALFAFRSPLSKGAILADEVGLGKTIEAGIVLAQKWAERKRTILLILPSSLPKQWYQELQDKFYLPSRILESGSFNKAVKAGSANPFDCDEIVICSYPFEMVSDYLRRENLMALPASQRSLMTLIMRKLLASSTFAIAGALNALANKLDRMLKEDAKLVAKDAGDVEEDFETYDEYIDEADEPEGEEAPVPLTPDEKLAIQLEIQDLRSFYELAMQITQNAKGEALLQALEAGFNMARGLGGAEKAIIFTESRRTPEQIQEAFDLLQA